MIHQGIQSILSLTIVIVKMLTELMKKKGNEIDQQVTIAMNLIDRSTAMIMTQVMMSIKS